jgi:acid stress-induced BolA-like protein IbaG/YrbA
MPVLRRMPQQENHDALVDELVAEYHRGDQSPNREPLIVFEANPGFDLEHVYVVWDKWRDLGQSARSRLILDALERVLTREEMSRVGLAWGLTQEEWARQSGRSA